MAHRTHAIGNFIKPLLLAFYAASMAAFAMFATPALALNLANNPLFVTESQPPAVMLTMGRDHKLFYEAYNDYSDLNGDGTLDVGYKPGVIDYYGYFDSHKCYTYDSTNGLFNPAATTANKKCSSQWSGDFLNYVTTSRMDALRKVFYGGKRSTDSTTQTILERAFLPQDAHAWGKEYQSIARDGYDIREYTPLSLPATGRYHLFANVTLTGVGSAPLMRVLENSKFRVWEWLSIERPVAGNDCATGNNTRSNCVTASTTTTGYSVVPAGAFKNLQIATYNHTSASYPANHSDFDTWKTTYAIPGNLLGQRVLGNIDCNNSSCNPNSAQQDQYLTIITGKITVPADQTYSFSVDGDDAIEVIIDGTVVAGYYGGHGFCGCNTYSGSITLTAGDHDIEFRHQETTGGDGYRLHWQAAAITAQRTDYTVRVEVCNSSIGLEANCTSYGSSPVTYKPTGILQSYGSDNGIYFGMLSGSYAANTDGGVLRKNITSDSLKPGSSGSEILSDGRFDSTVNGIIATMNKLRIVGFRYSAQDYEGTEGGTRYYDCGWITTRQMSPGECQMWGNPIGEMVYEAIRYFSGKTTATASFVANPDGNAVADDSGLLDLPKPSWKDPYVAAPTGGGLPWCAKPYVMAVSDVYPSFDSDSVPGSPFNSFTGDLTGADVTTLGQKMWDTEFAGSRNVFIGQSTTSNFDSGPTAKAATTFGTLRGLAPGDPTRQGSFSSAELAYWGHMNNLSGDATKVRNLNFYSVALAPPLPKIEIPIGSTGQKVVIVPYAKSVGEPPISAVQGDFQPTNQIVDFYVDSIVNAPGAPTDATVNGGRAQYVFPHQLRRRGAGGRP